MKDKIFCSECRHVWGSDETATCTQSYREYLGAYEVTKKYNKCSDVNKDNNCSAFSNKHHLTRQEYEIIIVSAIILIATVLICSSLI